METQHMTQQTFADVLGISPASLSSIFNDRTKPTLNHVDAIKKKFPSINLGWLMYGQGPMFLDDDSQDSVIPKSPQSQPSSQQQSDLFGASSTPQTAIINDHQPISRALGQNPINAMQPVVKYADKQKRQITEIRIFFDDQTWETFVPKK